MSGPRPQAWPLVGGGGGPDITLALKPTRVGGAIKMNMIKYIRDMLQEFPERIKGTVPTLAADHNKEKAKNLCPRSSW